MIGEMRDRITIRRETHVADGQGGFTVTTAALYVRWGRVDVLTGREYFHAGQVSSNLTHKVTMRFGVDVTLSDSLVLSDGKTLKIDAIRDIDNRHRWLEIFCMEAKP